MTLTLWQYRRFIFVNALADLRHRFSGSVVGYLWNVFVPLAQIAVFAVIFSVLMGYRMPPSQNSYGRFAFIVFLCSGLLPWNAFSETLTRNTACLVANAGFLRKLPLPESIFVAKESMTGLLQTLLTMGLFLIFIILFTGTGGRWQWVQAIPMLVLFIAFAYGLGLTLGCLNVFFRDIQPLMNVVVLLWFWLTPITYAENIFDSPRHKWMLQLMYWNPAYHFVKAFQQAVYESQWITGRRWLICLGCTVAANLLALPVMHKLRAQIRDVL